MTVQKNQGQAGVERGRKCWFHTCTTPTLPTCRASTEKQSSLFLASSHLLHLANRHQFLLYIFMTFSYKYFLPSSKNDTQIIHDSAFLLHSIWTHSRLLTAIKIWHVALICLLPSTQQQSVSICCGKKLLDWVSLRYGPDEFK